MLFYSISILYEKLEKHEKHNPRFKYLFNLNLPISLFLNACRRWAGIYKAPSGKSPPGAFYVLGLARCILFLTFPHES
jgi:hypothetical protein